MYACVCLSANMCKWMQLPKEARRGHQILWCLSKWAAMSQCCDHFETDTRFILILCSLVFCLYVCLHEGVRSLRAGVIDGCELPCGCWELDLGPLEEQCPQPWSYLSRPWMWPFLIILVLTIILLLPSFLLRMRGVEPRASQVLDKHSTTELHSPSPYWISRG